MSELHPSVSGFDWDIGNRDKCQKHGVSIVEIESLFSNSPLIGPDLANSEQETRFRAIGKATNGRAIFAVFTLRQLSGATRIRPISARYIHEKEVRFYEQFGA